MAIEIEEIFTQQYQEVAQAHNGGFVPAEAAFLVAREVGKPDLESAIFSLLHHPRFENALYDDVPSFLTNLHDQPNHVMTVWTQGEARSPKGGQGYQVAKIASSSISLQMGHQWRNQERTTGVPRVVSGFDKKILLPELAVRLFSWNPDKVVVVDDNQENLSRAFEMLSSAGLSVVCYHMDRKEKNVSLATQDPAFHSVTSFVDISIKEYAASRVAWLLDLDYTLLDHGKVKTALQQQVKSLVERNEH